MLHAPFLFRMRYMLLFPALGLAFFGQYLFTGEWFTRLRDSNGWEWAPQYTLASICLLAAIVCAGWAAATRRSSEALLPSEPIRLVGQAYPVLLAALGCYLLSLERYLTHGESLLVQILWVASGMTLALGLWCTTRPSRHDGWALYEYAIVGVISLAGLMLRTWELGQLPSHIDNDIPWVGTVARDMITKQDYRWIGYSSESVHLQSYTQFYAWSMRLLGENLFGLIVTSAIAGTLTLPVVYALGREMYGRRVGLLALALLAFNYTHIHFSRTMFGPKATLFAALTFYLAFRGLRQREPIWFALGGLAGGIGLLFYDSSRVIPIIALAVVAWWLIVQRAQLRANAWGIVLFGLGLLVGFGPMLGFALTHFDEFLGRGNVVTIWSPEIWEHATAVYGVKTFPEVIVMQAARTFLTFHLYGDASPHFAFPRPMVDTLTAAFLVVGLGVLIFRLRDTRAFCLLAWIGLTLILGGVLTYDPPYWPHLNIALPAVVLIAAVGADRLISIWPGQMERRVRSMLQWALVIAIGLTAIQNWDVYYSFVRDNAGPRNRISRFISSLAPGYQVIMVSDEYTPDNYAFQFFNRDVPIEQRREEELLAQLLPPDQPHVFILHRHDSLVPILKSRYPRVEVQHHTDRDGNDLFVTIQTMPEGRALPAALLPHYPTWSWAPFLLLGMVVGWGAHAWWTHYALRVKERLTI